MLSTKFKFMSFAVVFLGAAILFVYPHLKSESAPAESAPLRTYGQLANVLSKCNTVNRVTEPTISAPFSPAASLCINGSLVAGDPQMFRSDTVSNNGTGLGTCPGPVDAKYDAYGFNLSGCAAFPTKVRITLCGPAGCVPPQALDTRIYIYRNVAAGDTLTANGGLPAVFNPASPCTNLRGANDTLSGGASNTAPNGNSCSQSAVPGQTCEGVCATSTSLAGFHRFLGNGRFTIVVTGTNTADLGSYNLYVEAASAGCSVALAPTDANANISGRVVTSTGQGISKATLTVSGGGLGAPITLRTNSFGYYNFSDLPIGGTYIVTVSSKMHTFAVSTRAVTLEDNVADIDFVSEQ